jgi:HNH endonuclease
MDRSSTQSQQEAVSEKQNQLTRAWLKELLRYDLETGAFYWRTRPRLRGPDLTGRRAGFLCSLGYWHIGIDGKLYLGHRLAWLYVHGRFPSGELDHINGIRSSCRIADLREGAPNQNRMNSRTRRDNRSGFKGVIFPLLVGKSGLSLLATQRT